MSMAIEIRAEVGRLDSKRFTKAMETELEKVFVEAARAFLIAATRRIPVRTGFLRGAFSRLEDVVGSFEFGSSRSSLSRKGTTRKRGRGIGSRPGRDSAGVALRFVALRDRQNKILKRISKLRKIERERFADIEKARLLGTGEEGTPDEVKISESKRAAQVRRAALRQRAKRQELIKQGRENAKKIDALAKSLETRYKIKLGKRLGDSERKNLLLIEGIQEAKERKFFRALRNLRRARFGYITTRNEIPLAAGVRRRVRVKGTMSAQEYEKRLRRLRDRLKTPSALMRRAENRLKKLREFFAKSLKGKNVQIRKRIEQKVLGRYQEKLKNAKSSLEEDEILAGAKKDITRALERASAKIRRRADRDHPLLAVAAHRRSLERLRKAELYKFAVLANLGQEEKERLNIVGRTRGGRIVGQTSAGKFDLRAGESLKSTFKLIEFYYPIPGNKTARVQKTPRSGRIFATVPSQIITKRKGFKQQGSGALNQIFRIAQVAKTTEGKPVKIISGLAAASRDFADVPTAYEFNFGIRIRYYSVNDIKLLWLSWQAGISAFNRYLAGNVNNRIPKLQDFMLTETHTLTGTTTTIRVGR